MTRTLMVLLLGTSFLMPMEAAAQRARPRNAPHAPNAPHAVPANTARLARCRAPVDGRSYVCRDEQRPRVVYRYSGGLARPVWIAPQWGRVDVVLPRNWARDGDVEPGRLRALLGRDLVWRVHEHGLRAGLKGPVRGHWVAQRRLGTVLVLTMRGQEVARLVDYDHDRVVDDLVIRNFRMDVRVW